MNYMWLCPIGKECRFSENLTILSDQSWTLSSQLSGISGTSSIQFWTCLFQFHNSLCTNSLLGVSLCRCPAGFMAHSVVGVFDCYSSVPENACNEIS
jgi:hypothetical protein